jgi:hypothetical protein
LQPASFRWFCHHQPAKFSTTHRSIMMIKVRAAKEHPPGTTGRCSMRR